MQTSGGLLMLTITKFDRYDMVNNPLDSTASFTIWFSGCTFNCKGCYNQQLQDKSFGTEYTAQQVYDIVVEHKHLGVKSVVLIGGEPLQQNINDLLSLCKSLHDDGMNIWLYTGYEFDDVDKLLLQYLYTIKCGRYNEEMKQDGFPASSNQQVYRSIAGVWENITEHIRRTNN